MAKKFLYRGKPVEEVKQLSLEDFIKLCDSHERRTLKRMSMPVKKFLQKFRKAKRKNKIMKTHYRQMVVVPEMIDARIQVYNGHKYVDVVIVPEMLGHRIGEYSHTTKLVKHSGPGVGATRGSKAVELK